MPTEETLAKIAAGFGLTFRKLEEEVLESRDQRLREEEQAKAAQAASPPPVENPYRRAVHEGAQNIAREIERLLLLAKDLRS